MPVKAQPQDQDQPGYLQQALQDQQHQIERLSKSVEALTRAFVDRAPARGRSADDQSRELPYRFDAAPKWMEASGWKEKSPAHRRAWPLLRRLLEIERWPGAHIRTTIPQLAEHLGVSEDTAKRRLRDLEGWGVIRWGRGDGRRPSVVEVQHPIDTPHSYSEVSWAEGGMDGAPPGYLESLSGPKRHYAELYGVVIPSGEDTQDQGASPPSPAYEEVPAHQPAALEPAAEDHTGPQETAGGSAEPVAGDEPSRKERSRTEASEELSEEPQAYAQGQQGGHVALPGGAVSPPLEIPENSVLRESFSSDARAHGEEHSRRKDQKENSKLDEIEARIREIPPQEVSEEAASEAKVLVDALGRYDAESRARMALSAEYLLRGGERNLLRVAASRIRRTRRESKVAIARPSRYLCRVIADLRENALSPQERELAKRVVLAAAPEDADGGGRGDHPPPGEEKERDFKAGYEWFFGGSSERETQDQRRQRRDEEGRQRCHREEVAGLFQRSDRTGERMRRLRMRVAEGRLAVDTLLEQVARELAGDHLAGERYREAVSKVLEDNVLEAGDQEKGSTL